MKNHSRPVKIGPCEEARGWSKGDVTIKVSLGRAIIVCSCVTAVDFCMILWTDIPALPVGVPAFALGVIGVLSVPVLRMFRFQIVGQALTRQWPWIPFYESLSIKDITYVLNFGVFLFLFTADFNEFTLPGNILLGRAERKELQDFALQYLDASHPLAPYWARKLGKGGGSP